MVAVLQDHPQDQAEVKEGWSSIRGLFTWKYMQASISLKKKKKEKKRDLKGRCGLSLEWPFGGCFTLNFGSLYGKVINFHI